MAKIKIVTDSSVTIKPELLKEFDITFVPLSVMIDGVVYSDGDLKEEGKFLQLMAAAKALPKTSQPSVGSFSEVYQSLHKAGAEDILSIHISQSLSGTVEAARQGALLAGLPVKVVDSQLTDQAMAFQVLAAAKLAQAGASMDEILTSLEEMRSKTELYLGVSTLENLIKGGRIGRVSGLLGSLLNIKVIMQMQNAHLKPVVKGRGQKTFTKWLQTLKVDLAQKQLAEIAISYSGQPDFALALKDELADLVDQPITVLETGSVIQTHTGEGAFAIMVRYA